MIFKRTILLLLLLFVLLTALQAQQLYTGVWRQGSDGYYLWSGVEWDNFNNKWKELGNQNLRLVDIETYTRGGKRLYSGVWREGKDGYYLWAGVEWDNFNNKWKELAKQNLRLIDMETYVENGKRLYIGVWREGTDGYYLWAGVDWDNFNNKWKELGNQNLRLTDIETYVENGKRLYAGVWRQGSDGYYLWAGVDWNNIVSKWKELAPQNLRLIDIESYVENGKRLYIGVWRQGSDGYYLWSGVDWESFTSKWAENGAGGLRLIDMETDESACDENCLNHVLMPDDPKTPGRDGYDYGVLTGPQHCEGLPGSCPAPGPNDYVYYRWPNLKIGNDYYARNSVLFDAKDQIFTLPFKDKAGDLWHNAWLYSPGSWHHAIDYQRNDKKTFQVCAAAPGKVIHIGWDTWSGGTMVISHDAGGKKDVYRTIYMHLRNGAANDCDNAWTKTMPTLNNDQKTTYKAYLESTGCPLDKTKRSPKSDWWGTEAQKMDMSLLGKTVSAGQAVAWAGSTGPGGCGCMGGGSGPNTHLHLFFAHKDPTDSRWYFFDPYGIYSYPDCYPKGVDEAINTPCARYPVSWKNGSPQYAP
jgi:hypothetical protein